MGTAETSTSQIPERNTEEQAQASISDDVQPSIRHHGGGTTRAPTTSDDVQPSMGSSGEPSTSHNGVLSVSDQGDIFEFLDSSADADEEVRRILDNFEEEMAMEFQDDIMHGFDLD